MHKLSSRVRKGLSGILTAAMIGSAMSATAFADTTLKAGTYDVDATLSCYVNAMGGVEFSDGYGLLKDSTITVDESGDAEITLELGTTSGLSIYGVACTAFIGTDENPGYYVNGSVVEVSDYTVSEATAANASGQVNYIESITFPVDQSVSEYTMWLYLDSNVMGCQLGDGSGSGASNTPGVATAHTATLTIDWDSIDTGSNSGSENTGSGSTTEEIEGTVYHADMTLSCYVNAMGGVEFSDGYGLLKGNSIVVDEDNNYTATLKLGTTSGLSIYGVACTAFIGTDETPGYYDADGDVLDVDSYTVSDEKVANANGQVNYITSITFPVEKDTEEYTLWLYLDSNVMGCQLGDGSGSGASNNPGVATAHTAILTIDWDTLAAGSSDSNDEKFSAKATIEYVVECCYEVDIPATIEVDAGTKTGEYTVNADAIPTGGYMIVTADSEGVLTNDQDGATIAFTNELSQPSDSENEGTKLMEEGDYLEGKVTITGKASSNGTYTGTLNFTINCY